MTKGRRAAIVTGGRRGIGRGACYALASAGFDVVVVDVEEDEEARTTIAGLGERGAAARFVRADIAELDQHAAILDTAYETFGTIDCLVNNAGVSVKSRGDLLDVQPDSFDRVMGINLRGTFFLTQAAARRMISEPRTSEAPDRSIITVSSANARLVAPDRAEYCFSKTGLAMMTKLFAVRLAEHRIHTYEIRPGIIRTDMTAIARDKYDRLIGEGLTPVARWGMPQDVGTAVASLASGAMPFSTGDAFHVDGGLHIHMI